MGVRATRITTKGQVVIPKEFRDRTGLSIGDSVSLVIGEDEVRIANRTGWAQATAGCLESSLPPLEPSELDERAEQIALDETRKKYGITG